MRKMSLRVLGAVVAFLCVLAFLATCAAWILMDAQIALPFLRKVDGATLLLTCGSTFLVLCMVAFSFYVSYRRAAQN